MWSIVFRNESRPWDEVASGLVERGICDVIPLSEVLHVDQKPILGGLFGVPKGEEVAGIPVFRLIMDLRPINQLFEAIAGDLHTLPMLSQVMPLEVFPDEEVLISSEDIKAMFYIIGLPSEWRPLLAFGREVPSHLRPPGVTEACVLTSRVLPMGFLNSVSVAQSLHRSIVNRAVDHLHISREQEIRRDQPLPSTALSYRVYLDNFDALFKTNREAAGLLEGTLSPLAQELREVYEDRIPVNEKKSSKSSLAGEMQGGLLDGVEGIVSPKPDKIARYLRGAWYLLQCKRTDLKRIQMVAGGLVYLFSYRRCLMSCLNETWRFVASFQGASRDWKEIPHAVKEELYSSVSLAPLAYINLRAPYDPMVSASDASESGGGLSFSVGLTDMGVQATHKSVRGAGSHVPDDTQLLVISLFDGIGPCRVALDLLGAQVAGYIAVEQDACARRVVESNFASVHFVERITEESMKSFACRFSRVGLVLISGGHPCQEQPEFRSTRDGSRTQHRSECHQEIPRVRELAQKYFPWALVHVCMEGVATMSEEDRSAITRSVGILPYEIDAVGVSPCRRNRLFWFTWKVEAGPDIMEIIRPATAHCNDYGRISFLLLTPDPYLTPGWSLAGGAEHKLPSFATAQPKARPVHEVGGASNCSARDLEYWSADRFRFPAYQYKYQHGITHPRHGWRLPTINEREVMLGFPLDYTLNCWPKGSRKQDPTGFEDCRMCLLGNSSSVPVVSVLLERLLRKYHLCEPHTVREIQLRCQPGQSSGLSSFLNRPPWKSAREPKSSDNDVLLIRKLGSLMSSRGTDVLLQADTEPVRSHDRLRTSVPARLWKWKTACGWAWRSPQSGCREHINRLELRAVLTAVKWRTLKARQRGKRFLHLVDSLVSLHVVNKGRSSSRKLRAITKRLTAWLLLSANFCILGYVDTGQNPADAPSRRSHKRKWGSAS